MEHSCTVLLNVSGCYFFRAEGSSKIQARIEQQSARASQPPTQFRAPTKPAAGPKTSPLKDNPSPEPQLDDIKRGKEGFVVSRVLVGFVLFPYNKNSNCAVYINMLNCSGIKRWYSTADLSSSYFILRHLSELFVLFCQHRYFSGMRELPLCG